MATATFEYNLKTSTGYEQTGKHSSVTPEQFGQLVSCIESVMHPDFSQKRFETWVKKFDLFVDPDFTKDVDGVYVNERINEQWVVWQSCLTFGMGV